MARALVTSSVLREYRLLLQSADLTRSAEEQDALLMTQGT